MKGYIYKKRWIEEGINPIIAGSKEESQAEKSRSYHINVYIHKCQIKIDRRRDPAIAGPKKECQAEISRSCYINKTIYEKSLTMCRITGVILQRHQKLHLPLKINSRN